MKKQSTTAGPTGFGWVRSLLTFRHRNPVARFVSTLLAFAIASLLVVGTGAAYADDTAPAPADTTATATPDPTPADPPAEPAADPTPADAPADSTPAASSDAPASDAPAASSSGDTAPAPAAIGAKPQATTTTSFTSALQTLASSITVDCVGGPGTVVGGFEIDGNLCPQGNQDWNTPVGAKVEDGLDDHTTFTGGTSEGDDPAGWSLGTTSPNGKTDIETAWAFSKAINNTVYGYFAITNASDTGGTSQYDVEYNQLDPTATGMPNRSAGDLLFRFNSTGSNVIAFTDAKKWTLKSDNAHWSAATCQSITATAGWCTIPIPANAFDKQVNADGTFFEGAINIGLFFPGSGDCSGNFGVVNIRSVTGNAFYSSSLKDYVTPLSVDTPSTCGKIIINKQDGGNTPIGGATFSVSPNPIPGQPAAPALSITDNDSHDANPADGVIEISPVTPNVSYTVTETAAPTGYFLASPASQGPTLVAASATISFTFHDPKQYDALTASKTVDSAGYTRTYDWGIEKYVSKDGVTWEPQTTALAPAKKDVAASGPTTFFYKATITALPDPVDTNIHVNGQIKVSNPNDVAVSADLSDDIPGATCTVEGSATKTVSVAANAVNAAYNYTCTFASVPALLTGTNTATVEWSKSQYPQAQGDIGASGNYQLKPTAPYTLVETPVHKTVKVTDTDPTAFDPAWTGVVWSPGYTETRNYTHDLTVVAGACTDVYDNTARVIAEDDQTILDHDTEYAQACGPGTWTVAKENVDGDGPVAAGSTLHYRLTATRTGEVNPKNVVVTDDLNTLVPYLDGNDPVVLGTPLPAGQSVGYVGGVLTWTIAELGATPQTLDFTVTLAADAYGVDLPNVVVSPGSENCPDADTATKVDACTTDNDTPHFTLAKSSDAGGQVLPPYLGDPGTLITYTLTVHNDSDAPINSTTLPGAQVTDDLSAVLDDATFVAGSIDPAGQATLVGNILTWTLPEIAPDGTAVLTYQVRVNGDQWNETLTNTAAPGDGGDCVTETGCSTTTVTPPYTQLQALKVDAETGAGLAGAEFTLSHGGEVIDTATSGANGIALFGVKLQPGDFTITETKAPDGYSLPINGGATVNVTIQAPDAEGTNFVANGPMAPITFADPATGQLTVVSKQQFERDPLTNAWVLSDGVVNFGDQIHYVVHVQATGKKLFHNVTATDYVPGYNPADTTTSPAGTKAILDAASPSCTGEFTCTVSANMATGLVTWTLTSPGQPAGTLLPDADGSATGTFEMTVTMPNIPATSPIKTPGTSFAAALWNQGYLGWDQVDFVDAPPVLSLARVAAAALVEPAMTHHTLSSNEVVVRASATLPPQVLPPQVSPPSVLPNTGGPDGWLLTAGLLLLLGGGVLVASDRRRRRRS